MNKDIKKRLLDILIAALVAAAAAFLGDLLKNLHTVLPAAGLNHLPSFAGALTYLSRQV